MYPSVYKVEFEATAFHFLQVKMAADGRRRSVCISLNDSEYFFSPNTSVSELNDQVIHVLTLSELLIVNYQNISRCRVFVAEYQFKTLCQN